MDLVEFREYCLSLGEVEEKMPFGKFAARYDSILVFYVCGHMFCLVDIDDFTYADIKLAPEKVEELRLTRSSATKPFNLSERHWVDLAFGGDISDNEIRNLVKNAFEVVKAQYTPRTRRGKATGNRGGKSKA